MKKEKRTPVYYSPEVAEYILVELADGRTLSSICREDGMPTASAVCGWVFCDDPKGFAKRYAHARETGYQRMADEVLDLADDTTGDYATVINARGKEVKILDHENINRSRLRVDTRKWMLSKVLPKIYGDKLDLNHSGAIGTVGERLIAARKVVGQ